MSLLGFDAIGRLALAQIQRGNISMQAVSGSFAISGASQTFSFTENVVAATYNISGADISQSIAVTAGSFSLTGVAQVFGLSEAVDPGAYVISGSVANNINGSADAGTFQITGVNQQLIWTGAGVDTSYTGGVGHFLEEMERQRQLNAITRKTPGRPIDRRTIPRFEPLRAPPIAPASPAPDMAAIQNQRMAEAAAQAKAAKRRRDEEALLLLAS